MESHCACGSFECMACSLAGVQPCKQNQASMPAPMAPVRSHAQVLGPDTSLGDQCRVVEVEEVAPGCRPLSNGLYVQGEYDRAFVTFSDGPNHVPASRAKYAGKQRVGSCQLLSAASWASGPACQGVYGFREAHVLLL